jgi:transposase-like protein
MVRSNKTKSLYRGHPFAASIISVAMRRYFPLRLSLHDIVALLLEGGMIVSYTTNCRWCDPKIGASCDRRDHPRVHHARKVLDRDRDAHRDVQFGATILRVWPT